MYVIYTNLSPMQQVYITGIIIIFKIINVSLDKYTSEMACQANYNKGVVAL